MTTPDSTDPDTNFRYAKRGRKPKTGLRQGLAEAKKQLTLAQERYTKALVQVDREQAAELARTGRYVYLKAVERLHSGERALLVDPILADLSESDREAVQTWMHSLLPSKRAAR